MTKTAKWKIHTPNLLKEVLNSNPNMAIFAAPFTIFGNLLSEVGARASELNDPQLNALMCRLTIYEVADPESPNYNPELIREILEQGDKK